jgi:hypothetical protein
MTLRRIDALSCAKVVGALYAVLGLFAGGLFTLFALLGTALGTAREGPEALFGLLFGVGAVVLLPIMYGVLGFLAGLIGSALYNVAANVVGGIQVELS